MRRSYTAGILLLLLGMGETNVGAQPSDPDFWGGNPVAGKDAPLPSPGNPVYYEVYHGTYVERILVFSFAPCQNGVSASFFSSTKWAFNDSALGDTGLICNGVPMYVRNNNNGFSAINTGFQNGEFYFRPWTGDHWSSRSAPIKISLNSIRRASLLSQEEYKVVQRRGQALASSGKGATVQRSTPVGDQRGLPAVGAMSREVPLIANGPSINDLLRAHARSHVAYVEGQVTSASGDVGVPSPGGGYAYYWRHNISDAKCTRVAAASFRCTYALTRQAVPDKDSIYGAFLTIFLQIPVTVRYDWTFTRSGGAWHSNGLDDAYRQVANRMAMQGVAASNALDNQMAKDEAFRKDQEKRVEAMQALWCVGREDC